jgi:hypothetical protein
MVWRSGLVLAAAALSAFAVPATAALYVEAGIDPPAASIEVVPDRTYTYTYEPGYVERHTYVMESPRAYYYTEPRVYIEER